MNTTQNAVEALGTLFESRGYLPYKMSKFEEYDLYARNKDFLISDGVITFTDTNGKLMALKPDVTLSIVKNSKDLPWVQKVYYKENVYRVSRDSHGYREIMQVGLEAMGDIDDYCVAEVLSLAARSLQTFSPESVLEVSHLGILKELTDSMGIPLEAREALVKLISEKNPHELTALCRGVGLGEEDIDLLRWLAAVSGKPQTVLPQLREKLSGKIGTATLDRMEAVLSALSDCQILRVDFSVVDDIHYYNGFVFRGFISGIPDTVLSGGQYDKLMKKMNRSAGAIGFAVYTDLLQRLDAPCEENDVDILLIYEDGASLAHLFAQARCFEEQGLRVMVQRQIPENIRYGRLVKFNGSEVRNDA